MNKFFLKSITVLEVVQNSFFETTKIYLFPMISICVYMLRIPQKSGALFEKNLLSLCLKRETDFNSIKWRLGSFLYPKEVKILKSTEKSMFKDKEEFILISSHSFVCEFNNLAN